MEYPKFNTHILIMADREGMEIYTDKLLIEKIKEGVDSYISVSTKMNTEKDAGNSNREWVYNSSMFDIYITDNFINDHFTKGTEEYKSFTGHFQEFLKPFEKISEKINASKGMEGSFSFAPFTLFYLTNDGYTLKFLFQSKDENPDYIAMFQEALSSIVRYNEPEENDLKKAVSESYSKKEGYKYLSFSDGHWKVLNPLFEVGREINEKYRKGKDDRIKKPHIILNKDDFSKYFVFDSNWVLVFDKLETMLIQPNDVALYSSISEKNLNAAKNFYNKTILPRHKQYGGAFPTQQKQQEYYDYFELIITSIIFAYTALEAFANICIPNGWEYRTEANGVKTIYSKEAIERRFNLRDKFKKMLKNILQTPDPTTSDWWQDFIKLEDIRNEIAHTKQAKSEERYSRILSQEILGIIENHKKVISFYGEYISRNKTTLLEEFPYEFGYDDFLPGLMTNKNYEKSYKARYNINLGNKEK